MSSQTNNPYLVKSMNGVITIDDGMGTVIEDGIITTNELDVTTLKVETLSTNFILPKDTGICQIWRTGANTCYFANAISGTANFATATSGNVVFGTSGSTVNASNISIGTSTGLTGEIRVGNSGATSKIRLNSPSVECAGVPTSVNAVVNKTYADGLITALKAATNIWTGVSNTFNNVIYCSLIQPLIAGGILAIGTAATNILSLGNTTGTVNITSSSATIQAVSLMSLTSGASLSLTSSSGGASLVAGGTNVLVTSDLANATVSAPNGNISILGSGPITLTSSLEYVDIEGIRVQSTSLQSATALATADFFNSGTTATLNIGNNATLVNIGGTRNNIAVNGNYSHEFNSGSSLAFHDFHSYNGTPNDYDARISASLAVAGTATARLTFTAFNNRFEGGISFSKGNLSSPQNIQAGSASGLSQVAANSPGGAAIVVTFPTAFTSTPVVVLTNSSTSGASASGLIVSVTATTSSNFSFLVYNARNVNSGLWGYKWIAIGGY